MAKKKKKTKKEEKAKEVKQELTIEEKFARTQRQTFASFCRV